MVRAVDKADVMLTLSSALYNQGAIYHLQHVLADRTNCRVSVAPVCLLRYVLQLNGAS